VTQSITVAAHDQPASADSFSLARLPRTPPPRVPRHSVWRELTIPPPTIVAYGDYAPELLPHLHHRRHQAGNGSYSAHRRCTQSLTGLRNRQCRPDPTSAEQRSQREHPGSLRVNSTVKNQGKQRRTTAANIWMTTTCDRPNITTRTH